MNNELLQNAISNIDCKFIEEASEFSLASAKDGTDKQSKRRIAYFGMTAAAAAAVAVAIIVPLSVSGTIEKPNDNLPSGGMNGGGAPGGSSPQHIYGLGHTQTGSLGSVKYTERGDYFVTFELEITDNRYNYDIDVSFENNDYIVSTDKELDRYHTLTVLDSSLLVVTVDGEQAEKIPNQVGRYVVSVDYSACKIDGNQIIFGYFSVWYWTYYHWNYHIYK
ncbi:MAG: hypothetical protein J1F71_03520 [Clostridiales bacterium]|nr:hypothetical protein [Clostridiales bacterium]